MVYCCVPNCRSKKGTTPNVSFHEFPVHQETREKWLKNISRKDFQINDKSNSTVVCSLHFAPHDFIQRKKYRRLQNGAVPSIFYGYPIYMTEKVKPPRRILQKHSHQEKRLKVDESEVVMMEEEGETLLEPSNTESIPPDNTENQFLSTVKVCTASASTQTKNNILQELVQSKRERNALRLKVWRLNNKLAELQKDKDSLTEKLKIYDQCPYKKAVTGLLDHNDDHTAAVILEQLLNFKRKKPLWSPETLKLYIALYYASTSAYKFARKNRLLKLPSKSTLKRFIGNVNTQTGITDAIKLRLELESSKLTDADRFVSLIADEMAIKKQLQYDKQLDCFFGEKDTVAGRNAKVTDKPVEPVLAKQLLCFMIVGIGTKFKMPCAYFFTVQTSGKTLKELVLKVITEVERCGFFVLRFVTDNHKTNVKAMKLLCGGTLKTSIEHPVDQNRTLFLGFDPSHIIKNIRSLFFKHNMTDGKEDINGRFIQTLYEIQVSSNIKLVRFLSRKHVDPNNFEKMNVQRAVEIFSLPVTAALQFLKEHPMSHNKATYFADAGATIKFLQMFLKWWTLHDVSNVTHHVEQKNADKLQFFKVSDERLEWLLKTFLPYVKGLATICKKEEKSFLSKETLEALEITTLSTVQCTRHLLENGFPYILTRCFSSDPIESFFSSLRQMCGNNDMLDARALVFCFHRILKTGLVAASSSSSNVDAFSKFEGGQIFDSRLPLEDQLHNQTELNCRKDLFADSSLGTRDVLVPQTTIPDSILDILEQLKTKPGPLMTTMSTASLAFVAGYVCNAVAKIVSCSDCILLITQAKVSCGLLSFISNQDRGSLNYPRPEFVSVLFTLQKFVESAYVFVSRNKTCETMQRIILPKLSQSPVLYHGEEQHAKDLSISIINKFVPALLKNIGQTKTEFWEVPKYLNGKPLSRKILKI